MSYNITRFKVRRLELELPLTFDFLQWVRGLPDTDEEGHENIGKRWCLEDEDIAIKTDLARATWSLELFDQELRGAIENNRYITNAIDWQGEFSGYLYSDILLPLFKEFKGYLRALVVWERGDSVVELNIEDGGVSEVDLD